MDRSAPIETPAPPAMRCASIGIAGAGLLGRLLAWRLARAGHRVQVFDRAPSASPRFGVHGADQHAAGFTAAGMLSPLAELDNASAEIAALGWRSIEQWRAITDALGVRSAFRQRGSLMLAHRSDLGAAQRVLARITHAARDVAMPRSLDAVRLAELEPALQGAAHAWHLPNEAQIDAVAVMNALHDAARDVRWHWSAQAAAVEPGRIALTDARTFGFDWTFDVRGTGAQPDLPVRGVRGELAWLRLAAHGLTRPVRLLHPRHRVYLVPRAHDIVLVGATEIESEDRSPASVRSVVELLSAAHSVMPALAEARVLQLDTNLRPALPDNEPRVESVAGLTRINGLFRHGWLLAPALVEAALGDTHTHSTSASTLPA